MVDDSAFMRKLISEIINEDPRMTVIATARDGYDALKKVAQLHPDVITLDVALPQLTGIEVLKRVMAEHPTPTIMLSSVTDKGAAITIEAMALGAVGFITKPSGEISLDLYKVKEALIAKIMEAAASHVGKRVEPNMAQEPLLSPSINQQVKLICIGTSTGGPRALRAVISKLPQHLHVPIVVVQHMPATFTKSFADKLNQWALLSVKEAQHGELLHNGTVYIAPGGYHTKIKKVGRSMAFIVDQSPIVRGLRPSYDLLLESVADSGIGGVVTVTLTGMGSDGARGLAHLKRECQDVYSIAEAEETAVIFGMPKAAIKTGYIDAILNLEQIPSAMIDQIS